MVSNAGSLFTDTLTSRLGEHGVGGACAIGDAADVAVSRADALVLSAVPFLWSLSCARTGECCIM